MRCTPTQLDEELVRETLGCFLKDEEDLPDGERPPGRGRARRALLAGGMSAVSANLVEHTARFCRRLRAEGLPLGPGDTLDAARALGSVDLVDREDVRMGLRITLVKRVEDTPLFDALFESFWGGAAPVARNPPVVPPDADEESERPAAASPRRRSVQVWQELEELAVPAPSSREALGRQDFESFGEEELRAVTALARRIARRLSARPGRRWKLSRRGEQVSLRRTLREALKTGGEPRR